MIFFSIIHSEKPLRNMILTATKLNKVYYSSVVCLIYLLWSIFQDPISRIFISFLRIKFVICQLCDIPTPLTLLLKMEVKNPNQTELLLNIYRLWKIRWYCPPKAADGLHGARLFTCNRETCLTIMPLFSFFLFTSRETAQGKKSLLTATPPKKKKRLRGQKRSFQKKRCHATYSPGLGPKPQYTKP